MSWRRPLYGLLVVLVFFSVVEASLWLFGVAPLIRERDPFQGFSGSVRIYEADPENGIYRTRSAATLRSFQPQQFALDKPADGFRVFVVGGSSAYGFPWGPQVAFPHLLDEALRSSRPDRSIEVVNAAAMSYGSHRLRILITELLDYDPDLLVVYSGHNEFVERRFYRDLLDGPARLDRVRATLFRSRLYSAMTRAYESLTRQDPAAASERSEVSELLGLDVSREYTVDVGEDERSEALANFEANLAAIIDRATDAGVRVILCTVPSNLKGWVPNQSKFGNETSVVARQDLQQRLSRARRALDSGDAAAAVELLEPARAIDGEYAEIHFLLGRSYEQLGRYPAAREAYATARNRDAKPARATDALNDVIRGLADKRAATLIDIEQAFASESPHGIVGFSLIEDYVHPTAEGHRLIAFELWRFLEASGWLGPPVDVERASFDRALASSPSHAELPARTPALLYNLGVVFENQGLDERAMEKYRECLALDPNYIVARFNLGRLLVKRRRFPEAVEAHERTLRTHPDHVPSLIGLGEALRHLGRLDEAQGWFDRAAQVDPDSADAWNRLGVTLAQLGRHADAEPVLRRAVELDRRALEPKVDLGFTLLFLAKLAEARSSFEEAIELRPDHVRARNGLAAVLTEQGRFDDAERLFRENLSLEPGNEFARGGLEVLARRRAATP